MPNRKNEKSTIMEVAENNGMLRHSLGGEVIFFFAANYGFHLELNALYVCLSCSLLPACPPEGGNEGNNEQDRQTNRALTSRKKP